MPRSAYSTEPPDPNDNDEAPSAPSKTQRKQQMHALQDLGEQLVALSTEQLRRLALSESLFDAVLLAQKIRSHEGRRRQMQWIGKLMRGIDPTLIAQSLGALASHRQADVAHFHAIERWRDRLLHEDGALNAFLATYPHTEVQPLRQLIRNAKNETGDDKRAFRKLFQMLKQICAPSAPNASASPDMLGDVAHSPDPKSGDVQAE